MPDKGTTGTSLGDRSLKVLAGYGRSRRPRNGDCPGNDPLGIPQTCRAMPRLDDDETIEWTANRFDFWRFQIQKTSSMDPLQEGTPLGEGIFGPRVGPSSREGK